MFPSDFFFALGPLVKGIRRRLSDQVPSRFVFCFVLDGLLGGVFLWSLCAHLMVRFLLQSIYDDAWDGQMLLEAVFKAGSPSLELVFLCARRGKLRGPLQPSALALAPCQLHLASA